MGSCFFFLGFFGEIVVVTNDVGVSADAGTADDIVFLGFGSTAVGFFFFFFFFRCFVFGEARWCLFVPVLGTLSFSDSPQSIPPGCLVGPDLGFASLFAW